MTEPRAASHCADARPTLGAILRDDATSGREPSSAEHLARARRSTGSMREVKDDVLRMGSLVEEAIRGRDRAPSSSHDAEAALGGHQARPPHQRDAARDLPDHPTIATQSPVARDLRFLLTLDHVTYELERMGDHASASRSRPASSRRMPPLDESCDLPRDGRARRRQVHGVLRALIDVDENAARAVAAGDDDVDHLYHHIFDELLDLMRADPGERRSGHAHPVRGALPRAHRRPGHEHRRGHRVPGDGEVEDLNP